MNIFDIKRCVSLGTMKAKRVNDVGYFRCYARYDDDDMIQEIILHMREDL